MNDQASDDTSRSVSGALVPRSPQRALTKAKRFVDLTNKLLAPIHDRERQELVEFLVSIDEKDNFTISILSRFANIPSDLLTKYRELWDWHALSQNMALHWSEQMIEAFVELWHWPSLSRNQAVPWSDRLIKRFLDHWTWPLEFATVMPCSVQFLEQHIDRLNGWPIYSVVFPVSEPLIIRFAEIWAMPFPSRNTSFNWTAEFIEQFKDKLDWEGLSENPALPWSAKLIERFDAYWHWPRLSSNQGLPWSRELIDRFKDKWNWDWLSGNQSLPWSEDFFTTYKEYWNWAMLSKNEALPWSTQLIAQYENNWYWEELSANKSLPWSVQLIDQYKDRWRWWKLSSNNGLPWSEQLVDRYIHHWSWEYGLSKNEAIPWSLKFIESHMDSWGWCDLCFNRALPWSRHFIEQYKNRWICWIHMSHNKAVFEGAIQMHVNVAFIEEVMGRISEQRLKHR